MDMRVLLGQLPFRNWFWFLDQLLWLFFCLAALSLIGMVGITTLAVLHLLAHCGGVQGVVKFGLLAIACFDATLLFSGISPEGEDLGFLFFVMEKLNPNFEQFDCIREAFGSLEDDAQRLIAFKPAWTVHMANLERNAILLLGLNVGLPCGLVTSIFAKCFSSQRKHYQR